MAGLGIFFPYYSLYLEERLGLSGTQVGVILAVLPLVGILAQPFWGLVADRSGSRRGVLAILSVGVAAGTLLVGSLEGFWPVAAATALLAFFSTSVLAMTTAVTLAALEPGGEMAFGRVRVWGTVGFLAAVWFFPMFLASPTADRSWLGFYGLGLMFPVVAVLSLLSGAAARRLPATDAVLVRAKPGEARQILRHPPLGRLLLLSFGAHLCMQGPISLFPLYITGRGGDAATVGTMWLFMLLLEIPLIAFSGPLLRRIGARGLLSMGLLAEGLRWLVCGWSSDLRLVQAVQVLHGVGVAGVLVGGPLYLEQVVPRQMRSTGQALVSSAGHGAGAIVSVLATGWMHDHLGVGGPYLVAGSAALLLGFLVHWILPQPYRPSVVGDQR